MSSSAAQSAGLRPAPRYVEDVIRAALILTMFWGVVAFLAGVVIAAQLVWPQLSFDSPYLTFGRLRPLHTSAAIFAFGGTALIGTAFHVVQRTCRTRLFGGAPLGWFVLLGYQFFIV
ncbi:MAG: cbb3-type cytochrome c oxidase subunit I, partial [Burkholderiaceae bacterium]|nr:cbb3-type cytochrome c oxidase subunit I [Burkholderiaceae bacterium]